MSDSSLEEYRKINLIIERDSADATYKYALQGPGVGLILRVADHVAAHCRRKGGFREHVRNGGVEGRNRRALCLCGSDGLGRPSSSWRSLAI